MGFTLGTTEDVDDPNVNVAVGVMDFLIGTSLMAFKERGYGIGCFLGSKQRGVPALPLGNLKRDLGLSHYHRLLLLRREVHVVNDR